MPGRWATFATWCGLWSFRMSGSIASSAKTSPGTRIRSVRGISQRCASRRLYSIPFMGPPFAAFRLPPSARRRPPPLLRTGARADLQVEEDGGLPAAGGLADREPVVGGRLDLLAERVPRGIDRFPVRLGRKPCVGKIRHVESREEEAVDR